jgi:hypothetical protein
VTAAARLAEQLGDTRDADGLWSLARALHLVALELDTTILGPAQHRLSDGVGSDDHLGFLQTAGEVAGLQSASRFLLQVVDQLQHEGDARRLPDVA